MDDICKDCSLCCETYPIDVSYSDIVRWNTEDRGDIIREVSFINNYPEMGYGGFYIEKTLRSPKQPCPFLKDQRCGIYDTRPMACKHYPLLHDDGKCPKRDSFTESIDPEVQQEDMAKCVPFFNDLMATLMRHRNG